MLHSPADLCDLTLLMPEQFHAASSAAEQCHICSLNCWPPTAASAERHCASVGSVAVPFQIELFASVHVPLIRCGHALAAKASSALVYVFRSTVTRYPFASTSASSSASSSIVVVLCRRPARDRSLSRRPHSNTEEDSRARVHGLIRDLLDAASKPGGLGSEQGKTGGEKKRISQAPESCVVWPHPTLHYDGRGHDHHDQGARRRPQPGDPHHGQRRGRRGAHDCHDQGLRFAGALGVVHEEDGRPGHGGDAGQARGRAHRGGGQRREGE